MEKRGNCSRPEATPAVAPARMVTRLRLLADDLTGALDSAAQFVPVCSPVPTFWHDAMPRELAGSAAVDTGTREAVPDVAARRVVALAPALAGAEIAFKKIDSLLRGATAAEIAACIRAGRFATCVVAPAFPAQDRITREGRQLVRRDGAWQDTGVDLRAALQTLGVDARLAHPGEPVPAGTSLWDAADDTDLRRIVAAGRQAPEPVLWCGTGGLAGALAGPGRMPPPHLDRPLLGLFGSDHDVTLRQLEACGGHWLVLPAGRGGSPAAVQARLRAAGFALVSFGLPDRLSRPAAAERIGAELAGLVRSMPPPRTLLVAGGETLRALCGALGATSLEVVGQMLPGVPVSLLHGGRWEGVTVVSKSGAFGDAGLLRRLSGLDGQAAD